MLWNIDRIEEGTAVLLCEDGRRSALPTERLPAGAAEGDWGRLVDGVFLPDAAETEKRRQKIRGLLEDLLG
ncbi:DUF3006 domain-containing protein [Anaerofilum sp. BX8]|uniref:DUF3006 domain-containing protein n=1 Tax=Anaerofilum hominis TaxID=2763016 RepID=A0A923L0D3_9FIRM|nr:DUF3006 domain-containing protein [Anaerofilum hominis]MBC5580265.1 DUF3006 domain-containing protein [Anaerofilum hominis]